MNKILKFATHKRLSKYLKTSSANKQEPRFRVQDEHNEYDQKSTKPTSPKYTITDDRSLYAYYQLTKAAELDKILDRATRLKGAALVSKVKIVKHQQIEKTINTGSRCPKGRAAILLNDNFAEKPQRFVNCLSPSTYVCPHKHTLPNQWELMSWLTGRFEALFFDDNGVLVQRIELSEKNNRIVEIPQNVYHSFIALEPCSYLEIRNCAYQPESDRIYADWAPSEDSDKRLSYLKKLYSAKVGDIVTLGKFNSE